MSEREDEAPDPNSAAEPRVETGGSATRRWAVTVLLSLLYLLVDQIPIANMTPAAQLEALGRTIEPSG